MTTRIAAFGSLFVGNQRSFGQFEPATSRMWAEKAAYTDTQIEEHLSGKRGLGMVPVLDDGTVRFAAIDIDCHKGKPPIDLLALEQKARDAGLPLVICRSKSGGAHCYLFTREPVEAKLVRSSLAQWASKLGFPGVEVFPKQSVLTVDEHTGERLLGNWINLPYFNADATDRYCIEGGRQGDFDFFIETANAKRVGRSELVALGMGEHAQAPPCFQTMLVEGVPVGSGVRNKALYHAAVYLKRAFPGDWKERAHDFNNRVMEEPLPHAEAQKTINSAGRRDYRYRCNDSPCKELCQRAVCLTREFGIKDEPAEGGTSDDGFVPLPGMANLCKYLSEPVRWTLEVQGKVITLTTEALMDYRRLRIAVAEELTILMPNRKNETWHKQLTLLMETARLIEVPDEAGTPGLMRAKLAEYIKKANLDHKGDDIKERAVLLRGQPVVQQVENRRHVVFRYTDFVEFLKRTRSEELKGVNLFLALQKSGVTHTKMRVGETVIPVWLLPIDDRNELSLEKAQFRSDI